MSNPMTPEQRIKRQILIDHANCDGSEQLDIAPDKVNELFDAAREDYALQDDINEFRCSGVKTPGIKTPSSRNYESEAVAREIDGVWVGWTYWFGGGKHASPEDVDWISGAYELKIVETKTIIVNVFEKVGAA